MSGLSDRFRGFDDAGQVLAEFQQQASLRYPSLLVDSAGFADFVAERLLLSGRAMTDLSGFHGADLALTFGCTFGNKVALSLFDAMFIRKTAAYVRRADVDVDEVAQRLREKLLVSKRGELPRIADYLGTGPLDGFVRIAAVRCAISLRRTRANWRFVDEGTLNVVASGAAGPDAKVAGAQLAGVVRLAFTEAAQTLTHKQRQLLRFYHLEDTTLDKLALVYDVHLSTVARWIEQARDALRDATVVALKKTMLQGLPTPEEIEGSLEQIVGLLFGDPGLV